MTADDLAQGARERRVVLGLRQGDVAARAALSDATIRRIEHSWADDPRPTTMAGLDRALGWTHGSSAGLLTTGQAPIIETDTPSTGPPLGEGRVEAIRAARDVLSYLDHSADDLVVVADWLLTGRVDAALAFAEQRGRLYATQVGGVEGPDSIRWAPDGPDSMRPAPDDISGSTVTVDPAASTPRLRPVR